MKYTTIAFASTLAIAATTAFAQGGPDFSPLQPRLADPATAGRYDVESSRGAPSEATLPDNRMLQGYENSNLLPGEPATPPLASDATIDSPMTMAPQDTRAAPRSAIVPVAPRQSTIGNGLFNRRGPNDFGA